ncbi:phosphotransferase [Streptomyces sp. NPDC052225]|uniref:phosphotransferase family protein n=1 Tax=Streptomyces sp. NPDC052225 TaxID=3154949 RepID=UPI0034483669
MIGRRSGPLPELTGVRRAREWDGPRSRLWRAELAGTPVVVKQLVDAPEAADRYAREVTALRLASRVEPLVVPRLLRADPDRRILVLEHLEHREPRADWVIGYAQALARLHSATATGADAALPAWSGPDHRDVNALLALADALGAAVPPGTRGELTALTGRLAAAPGRALLHGDPCPGNDLHTGDGIKFIDFEQAALGNGLVELAYLHIGFPTCWCVTVPTRAHLDAAETAYRATWRRTTGTDVQGSLVDACAGWLLRGDALVPRAERGTVDQFARIPYEDWSWGTVTARERLAHRCGVIRRMTADSGELTRLGSLAAALRAALLTVRPGLRPPPVQRP